MCCSSKKKPQSVKGTTNSNVPPQSQPQTQPQPQPQPVATSQSQLPKSQVSFLANSYEQNQNSNQDGFLLTQKPALNSMDRIDRQEDYSHERNVAQASRLKQNPSLLTYNLDNDDGVSKIPIINTFHYQSSLHHCFLHHYNPDYSNNRNTSNSNQPVYNDASNQQNYGNQGYGNQGYGYGGQYNNGGLRGTQNENYNQSGNADDGHLRGSNEERFVYPIQQSHQSNEKSGFVLESNS